MIDGLVNEPVWMDKYSRWQIKVQRDGVRKTFYSSLGGRKGKLDCKRKAETWINNPGVDASIKVSVLFAKYINELILTTSRSHWEQYEYFGRCYLLRDKGNKKVAGITEQDLQDVILGAHARPVKGKPLSAKTLKNLKAFLNSFIKYARKNGVTTLYPESLYIPKQAAKSTRDTLQPKDIQLVFRCNKTLLKDVVVDEWFVHAYRFSIVMGTRPGELAELKTADIRDGRMYISRSLNKYNEITAGKNENATRAPSLPLIAQEVVKNQMAMLAKAGVISPYLFPRPDGRQITARYYRDRWEVYRDYNGISRRTPYEMRHTFFSALKDLPEERVKAVGGHGKTFDSFGNYGHEMDGESAQTALMIDEVFRKILK